MILVLSNHCNLSYSKPSFHFYLHRDAFANTSFCVNMYTSMQKRHIDGGTIHSSIMIIPIYFYPCCECFFCEKDLISSLMNYHKVFVVEEALKKILYLDSMGF